MDHWDRRDPEHPLRPEAPRYLGVLVTLVSRSLLLALEAPGALGHPEHRLHPEAPGDLGIPVTLVGRSLPVALEAPEDPVVPAVLEQLA